MTANDHAELVPGCHRCELGADETGARWRSRRADYMRHRLEMTCE